jgi:type II secretory pathway pseudopilin PulG
MPMPSRLAQLRNDSGVVLGCLGISALILGSLAIGKMTSAQSDKQAQQQQQIIAQQQAAAQLAGLAEAQRRAAIEANAQGWKAWQTHISARCSTVVHQLDANRSYVGITIGKARRPVYQGLILCDRDRAGILKGDELRLAWLVPRTGSKMPLPTGDPPPEFKPPAPIETVQ